MGEGEVYLVYRPLELRNDDACLSGYRQRFFVDGDDLVHAFHIEQDPTKDWQGASLGTRSTSPRHHRDAIFIGDIHNLGYLLR